MGRRLYAAGFFVVSSLAIAAPPSAAFKIAVVKSADSGALSAADREAVEDCQRDFMDRLIEIDPRNQTARTFLQGNRASVIAVAAATEVCVRAKKVAGVHVVVAPK